MIGAAAVAAAALVVPQDLELLVGIVVGVVWGGALLSSIVPHYGVSWQAHVCGAIGGVVAAAALRPRSPSTAAAGGPGSVPAVTG